LPCWFERGSVRRVLGVSFSEIVMIAVVALIVVGPRRLPEILGTLGRWIAKLRNMTTEVRRQTGIDDILREEGIAGGIAELRSIVRGDITGGMSRLGPGASAVVAPGPVTSTVDVYGDAVDYDRLREQPIEGPDAYGAIPEDLLAAAAPVVPAPAPAPPPSTATAPTPLPGTAATPPDPAMPSDVKTKESA
jgi:sec-independent protein translocase protein TatB